MTIDCKELDNLGQMLAEAQQAINARLRHDHAMLTVNERLRARHTDLINEVKGLGLAVRKSIELRTQADAAFARGDLEEAKKLMEQAAQALPDASDLPAVPSCDDDNATPSPAPAPDQGNGPAPDGAPAPAPAPQPAPPVPAPVPTPSDDGAPQAPDPGSASDDTPGMEQRLRVHIDQALASVLNSVNASNVLPDGYRDVLERFSPEDLERVLKAGRWVNQKRGNPFKRSDKSVPPPNNGAAADGAPQH